MITYTCHLCHSTKLQKNGRTKTGQQKFQCKACGFYGTLATKDAERPQRHHMVEQLQLEHRSQRAIARIVTISRTTICGLLKKVLTASGETIQPLTERPILEIDERWSFVGRKSNLVWVWIALERQTRRIVGFAIGARAAATCRNVWASLPANYRTRAIGSTDFWLSYAAVRPSKRHRAVGKKTGATAHVERFNNTLRPRCANLVRKTRSFSKNQWWHEAHIRLFIDHYHRCHQYRPVSV